MCGISTGDVVAVTRMLDAHKRCFCVYQCRAVLQTGSPERSPAADGRWLLDWRAAMGDYVTPECAAAVESISSQQKVDNTEEPTSAKMAVYMQLKAAAEESWAAFGQLTMLV